MASINESIIENKRPPEIESTLLKSPVSQTSTAFKSPKSTNSGGTTYYHRIDTEQQPPKEELEREDKTMESRLPLPVESSYCGGCGFCSPTIYASNSGSYGCLRAPNVTTASSALIDRSPFAPPMHQNYYWNPVRDQPFHCDCQDPRHRKDSKVWCKKRAHEVEKCFFKIVDRIIY